MLLTSKDLHNRGFDEDVAVLVLEAVKKNSEECQNNLNIIHPQSKIKVFTKKILAKNF